MVSGMRWLGIAALALGLGACTLVDQALPEPEVSGEARESGVTTDILVRPRARPEGDFGELPETDVEEVAAEEVRPVAAAGGSLGTTVASLGNPAEPGLWLKTPLVAAEQPGRVRFPATGKTVVVTLFPLEGPATAGSRMSLGAMQQIGVSPVDLPTVEVLAGA